MEMIKELPSILSDPMAMLNTVVNVFPILSLVSQLLWSGGQPT
jgi:hypothetical protein